MGPDRQAVGGEGRLKSTVPQKKSNMLAEVLGEHPRETGMVHDLWPWP